MNEYEVLQVKNSTFEKSQNLVGSSSTLHLVTASLTASEKNGKRAAHVLKARSKNIPECGGGLLFPT